MEDCLDLFDKGKIAAGLLHFIAAVLGFKFWQKKNDVFIHLLYQQQSEIKKHFLKEKFIFIVLIVRQHMPKTTSRYI